MGAGNAVLAHDNVYNRWVAGDGGLYFKNEDECESAILRMLGDEMLVKQMRSASRARHEDTLLRQDIVLVNDILQTWRWS